MCRIYGHIGQDTPSPHSLETVGALQIHGGPDAQTRSWGAHWSVGNNRLAIVDLDGGQQPYTLGDHLKVVFNGEIYNHRELRERLVSRGHHFSDQCDGSIIPALYMEYGLDFVRHLDGMFAIALVDLRDPVRLVLATDPAGVKSLYYHWDSRRRSLFFASEIPALLGFGRISSPGLWLPGVDAYLSTKVIFGERTLFDDILALPQSSLLVAGLGEQPRLLRWETLVTAGCAPDELAAAGDVLARLLDDEVRALLVADVPVATVNSGGLDSSFVTALASEMVTGISSFNISYVGDWPGDEQAYAREVARRHQTRHHEVQLDPRAFADLLPRVVWHLGQPNADPITLSTYALFRAVREAGFKVALSGDGADELFGGYDRLDAAMAASGDWVRPYVDALGAVDRATRRALYSDDYRSYIHDAGTAADAIEAQLRSAQGDRLTTLLDFEQRYRLPAYHLRRVDHLSMASSVEVRVPYCQPRIVSFSRQLSAELKISAGRVKRALYAAAAGRLPESILTRRKQPFTLPIAAMIRAGQPLYDFIAEVLDVTTIRRRGIFSPTAVASLLRRQREMPDGPTALTLWSLMILELWMQQFSVVPLPHSRSTER